jgi:two-component system LytT family response regulator
MTTPASGRTEPLRVLIVDDEPLARQRVADLLVREDGVDIVGTADHGRAAVDAIRRLQPDLVFLDVQMPGMTGLDVVRALDADMPITIFVTAYDRHALEAFDLAALDYLVKPFDDERFEQAFRRAREAVQLRETQRLHERLMLVLHDGGRRAPLAETPPPVHIVESPSTRYLDRISVESRGKVKFIPIADVDYIAASGPYAEVVVGTKRYLVRETMQAFEDRLDPSLFIRVHRSAIVPINRVDTLIRGPAGDYEVVLKNGARLRVSRSRREELERRMRG